MEQHSEYTGELPSGRVFAGPKVDDSLEYANCGLYGVPRKHSRQ